jgi:hypothetical protein
MIFDGSGKVVHSQTLSNPGKDKLQIDLSDKAAGMYFIKVVSDNLSVTKSISIKK